MHGFLNSAVVSGWLSKWSPVGRSGREVLMIKLGMFLTLATTNLLNSYQPPQGEMRVDYSWTHAWLQEECNL